MDISSSPSVSESRRTLLPPVLAGRYATSSFLVTEIPHDEAQSHNIAPLKFAHYNSQIEHFNKVFDQRNYQGALNLAHHLLYQVEAPLSIRFKCLWSAASAHKHLLQHQTAIDFLHEYLRCCDLLASSWNNEGIGADRVARLKESVRSRIEEFSNEMEGFENGAAEVGDASTLNEMNDNYNTDMGRQQNGQNLNELNDNTNTDMVQQQNRHDRESETASGEYSVETEQSEKSNRTATSQEPTPTPSIPPRSELRRQQSSELENNPEKQSGRIFSVYRHGNAFNSHPTGPVLRHAPVPAVVPPPSPSQSGPYHIESECQRLRNEIDKRDRYIGEQDKLIAENEDIIRKKDERFSEQVVLQTRCYDDIHEKEEQIRRLEAEVAIQKNQRELLKQIARPPGTVYVRVPSGSGSIAARIFPQSSTRIGRPLSAPSGSLHAPGTASADGPRATMNGDAAGASDQASMFGIPLLNLPSSSLEGMPAMLRSTTMPVIPTTNERRPPLTRVPRSLSTNNVGLASVPEISPPPPQRRASLAAKHLKGRGWRGLKGALAKTLEKLKSTLAGMKNDTKGDGLKRK